MLSMYEIGKNQYAFLFLLVFLLMHYCNFVTSTIYMVLDNTNIEAFFSNDDVSQEMNLGAK
jgi:hypothetical protein